jgi:hypothetical protein
MPPAGIPTQVPGFHVIGKSVVPVTFQVKSIGKSVAGID